MKKTLEYYRSNPSEFVKDYNLKPLGTYPIDSVDDRDIEEAAKWAEEIGLNRRIEPFEKRMIMMITNPSIERLTVMKRGRV